jgi:hypothetical protein
MSTTLTAQLQTTSTTNNQTPTEGPKVIPMTLDFTASQSIEVNLSYQQQQLQISAIQSVFVDNSLNDAPLVLKVGNNVQSLSIPGGFQAYLNIDCPNPPRFIALCTGGQLAKIIFQNFKTEPLMWSASGGLGNGDVENVSVPKLEALITDGGLNVNIVSGGGGDQPAGVNTTTYKLAGDAGSPVAHIGNGGNYNVLGLAVFNESASAVFLHVTPSFAGTGADLWTLMCPPASSVAETFASNGLQFDGGLTVSLSGGFADGDETAVTGACGAMIAYDNVGSVLPTGAHRYWRMSLLGTAGNAYSIADIQYRTSPGVGLLFNGGVPHATENYQSTDTTGPYGAYLAADNDPSTFWSSIEANAGQVWQYDFGAGNTLQVAEVSVEARNDEHYTQAPSSFSLDYSDDGIAWTTAQTYANIVWANAGQVQVFEVTNNA